MTDEELDRARAEEAWNEARGEGFPKGTGRSDDLFTALDIAQRAARLAREGWKAEDPLLKEARRIAGDAYLRELPGSESHVSRVVAGACDQSMLVNATLFGLRRGVELGKAKALVRDAETIKRMRREALKPGGVTFFK